MLKSYERNIWLAVVIILIAVIVLFYMRSNIKERDVQSILHGTKNITGLELVKNPEEYKDQEVVVEGKVVQFLDRGYNLAVDDGIKIINFPLKYNKLFTCVNYRLIGTVKQDEEGFYLDIREVECLDTGELLAPL